MRIRVTNITNTSVSIIRTTLAPATSVDFDIPDEVFLDQTTVSDWEDVLVWRDLQRLRTAGMISITPTLLSVVSTTVTVATGATTGTSVANPRNINGVMVGFVPTTQTERVRSIVLNADGSITVTLVTAVPTVAGSVANVFVVNVMRT